MNYAEMIFTLFVSIIVAIITAIISQRNFYKNELWLRKEKAYTNIINNLGVLQKHYSDMLDDAFGIKKYNSNDSKAEVNSAQRELERISLMPSFIIKSEVQSILEKLFHAASIEVGDEKDGNYFAYYERIHEEIKKSIKRITELARTDLKV